MASGDSWLLRPAPPMGHRTEQRTVATARWEHALGGAPFSPIMAVAQVSDGRTSRVAAMRRSENNGPRGIRGALATSSPSAIVDVKAAPDYCAGGEERRST